MRLLLLVALFVLLVSSTNAQTSTAASPAPVEIVKLEQNLWTTMAEGDFATVRGLFTPDFIQVNDHIQALDSLLITLKHCKLESYELRDLQVRILTSRLCDDCLSRRQQLQLWHCECAANQEQR